MPDENLLREGEALFQSGRKTEAEAIFQEVLTRSPGQLRALNNLAVMALADQRWGEAEDFIRQILTNDPHNTGALNNGLYLALIRGRWPQVWELAKLLLLTQADDIRLLKIVARVAVKLDKYEEAGLEAERLAALAPADVEALDLIAMFRLHNGDRDGAGLALKEALALAPERGDLAARLAFLKRPELVAERDMWPLCPYEQSTLALARMYHASWAEIPTTDPLLKMARTMGYLHDPVTLTDAELPLNPPPPPDTRYVEKIPKTAADVTGLSVMFAPTVIAGQSTMMSRWLRTHGAKTSVVEVTNTYLGYEADFRYPQKEAEIPAFLELIMKEAEKVNVLCLDFGSSFHYMPNFVSRFDMRQHKEPGQPYADLRRLKDKGVKIFFQFWGSDFQNQSLLPYLYLKYLGFDRIPKPPFQTRLQTENILAANELADAFLGADSGLNLLPRTAPFGDVYFEPERWPLKTNYRARVEQILTAPTKARKKNYTLTLSALTSFQARHPEIKPFRVQNTPHAQVPPLYAQADLGIDQAAFSFGTFSVEMMALGLPVICSRQPTHTHRDAAPVLSFNNIRELEARLEECAQNSDQLQKLGRQGREYVMEYNDIEVGGRVFSHYLAEVAAGGAVAQIHRPQYERLPMMWQKDPETVYALRFYDVAVPLFCALGELEYATQLCQEALDCGHRPEKFTAWFQAICQAWGVNNISLHGTAPETEELRKETVRRRILLEQSRALLQDSLEQQVEADRLKSVSDDEA